ncbi:hypothetical protein AURDEDRAFT_122877 [Auricularia subglabra TFB-10046 SS5]|nr:hypothetical protein AURDEDRAFT_122877 [Auricularia subglabra TFB-10046 SS5]
MSLRACLVNGAHPTVQGIKALKGFGKRGRWPESADKLFPFGPQQTVDMHVLWCSLRFSVLPIAFLGDTLHLSRPLTLPHLVASNVTRSKLVYILAQMLHADFSRVPEDWEGELPVTPACDANLPLAPPSYDQEGVIEATLEFLKPLLLGPDVRQLDFRPLFLGYGRVISKAVIAASRTMDTSAFNFPLLSAFMHLCHLTYDLPYNMVPPRLRASWPQVGPGANQIIPSNALMVWHNLVQLSRMRSCCCPDCTKTVHTNGGRPLALCGNCKTTRYCGKECQQRHWKDAKDPHKVICPLLRRLLAEASPGMPMDEFAAVFDRTLVEDERDRLHKWSQATAAFYSPEPQ